MKIRFQGLNANTKQVESFDFENILTYSNETEVLTSFHGFHLTFDNVYYFTKRFHNSVFIFNTMTRKFELLRQSEKDLITIGVSANTNYLWCLSFAPKHKRLELYQYTNSTLLNRTVLTDEYSLEDIEHLILVSTDINVYVFENEFCGVKCVHNQHQQSSSDDQKETKLLNENSTSSLPLNKILINEECKFISAGKEHVLFLTRHTNRLFTLGVGLKGQLGNGKIETNFFEPQRVKINENLDFIDIESGGWHSGCVSKTGDCYMWGWNSSGQIGVGNESSVEALQSAFVPVPVKVDVYDFDDELEEKKFKKLSIGSRHTALLDSGKTLYTMGWNKYEQLMLKENKETKLETFEETPIKVKHLDRKVLDVKCGCWFTLVLVDE